MLSHSLEPADIVADRQTPVDIAAAVGSLEPDCKRALAGRLAEVRD